MAIEPIRILPVNRLTNSLITATTLHWTKSYRISEALAGTVKLSW
jgi:hypothetical protein